MDTKVQTIARIIFEYASKQVDGKPELTIEREVFFSGIPGLTENEWGMAMDELRDTKLLKEYEWTFRGLTGDFFAGDYVDGLPEAVEENDHQYDILGITIHDPDLSLLAQFLGKKSVQDHDEDDQTPTNLWQTVGGKTDIEIQEDPPKVRNSKKPKLESHLPTQKKDRKKWRMGFKILALFRGTTALPFSTFRQKLGDVSGDYASQCKNAANKMLERIESRYRFTPYCQGDKMVELVEKMKLRKLRTQTT